MPQAVHPADYVNGRRGTIAGTAAGSTAVVARATAPVVPSGYKSLLTDGQINRMRGVGSAQGQASMDLVWTQTMPRKLIDVTTERDVTQKYPQIQYSYMTMVSTWAYLPNSATVYTPPRKKKELTNSYDAASPEYMEKATLGLELKRVQAVSASVAIETTKPALQAKAASHRFVQIATFGLQSNTRKILDRFSATGKPVISRPPSRGGKRYDIVLLGLFVDRTLFQAALSQACGTGFSDAFYVK